MESYRGVETVEIPGVYDLQPAAVEVHALNGGCVLFIKPANNVIRFRMDSVVALRDWLNRVIEKCQWDQEIADGRKEP